MAALLCLAGASDASDLVREYGIALEGMCKLRDAERLYEQAARGGDGKAAKRLSELKFNGRAFAEAQAWAHEARRLGEMVPAPKPPISGPLSTCKPQPFPGPGPGAFRFRISSWPVGDFNEVVRGPNGLLFMSARAGALVDPVAVKPSAQRWQEFRESVDRLNIWQWRSEYLKPITDGESWSLTIAYADRQLVAVGGNDYPDSFEEFVRAVDALLGTRRFR